MQRFFVLRKLTGSDLGWFAVPRRQGKARGRQRGINFNAGVIELIFGGTPKSSDIPVQTLRHSDGQTQSRSIKKQQKNWRLVGDMVWGEGLDLVDEGDFFWCIVELADRSRPILIWDVVSRRQRPDAHASIAHAFGAQLLGSMGIWEEREQGAARLSNLLGLEVLANEISDSEKLSSSVVAQYGDQLLRSGSSALRPRARLVQAIGQDLISNEIVALVELIKNAYDADARSVEISFEPPLRPGEGAINVQDDGHGMSLDDLQTAWMEPATVSKARRRFSPGGRRMTGEKGLGRFAAARLASKLRLDSVARGSGRRVVADFDWEAFRKEDTFLDQVQCEWREFTITSSSSTGTTLRLSELRDEWDFEAFRRLRAELSRLLVQRSSEESFAINLLLPPEFRALAGPITPPPVLSRPHYTLLGGMSKEGALTGELRIGAVKRSIKERITLKGGRTPICGPFSFDFKVWNRDELGRLASDFGSTITELRRDLNEAAGVSVYRDFFRVLPYGSAANDWLRLDLRRVQNPTMRLSNNQIVGAIYITADENPELRDQTNREGIVDSQAFEDLKACVGEILTHIEKARYELRRKADKLAGGQGSLFEELDLALVRAAFGRKYPSDQEFLDYLEEKDRRVKESVEQIQEVIVRYRRLATLGQLIDVVLHDGRTPIASISNQCDLGRRDLKKVGASELQAKLLNRLDTIAAQAAALSSLFNRISPFGGRKRSRPKEHILEDLISNAVALLHERVDGLDVKVDLPSTSTLILGDAAEVQHLIVNLLDNSLYWLAKVPREQRRIVVKVHKRENGIEILFSDSGPGVPEEVRDLIFDPYFSARPDGVGLGLTIAGEIASEYQGTLELIEPGLLDGANFRVTLKTRD